MLYRKCLDDVYFDMIKPYYTSLAGSLKLAIVANLQIIPNKALSAALELVPFHLDRLELVYRHSYVDAERWITSLADFLHDPSRSKRYSLRSMGPTIYRNAALASFQYLVSVVGHTLDIGLSLGTREVRIPQEGHPEHEIHKCETCGTSDLSDVLDACACLQLWRCGWDDVHRNESYGKTLLFCLMMLSCMLTYIFLQSTRNITYY